MADREMIPFRTDLAGLDDVDSSALPGSGAPSPVRWTYDPASRGYVLDLDPGGGDLPDHDHAGLSTTIPPGSLWGGDGTGIPAQVAIGSGLSLSGGTLAASGGGGSGITNREVAALDLSRVIDWDTGSGGPGPLGVTQGGGKTWEQWVSAFDRHSSGHIRQTDSVAGAIAGFDCGQTLPEVAGTFYQSSASRRAGIVIAYIDANNFVSVGINGSTALSIVEVWGGVTTTLASRSSVPLHRSRWIRIHGAIWTSSPGGPDVRIAAWSPDIGGFEAVIADATKAAALAASTRVGVALGHSSHRLIDLVVRKTQ